MLVVGDAVGVAAFHQHRAHEKQRPVRLPPLQAETAVDDVMGDSDNCDEDQEDDDRRQRPPAERRRDHVQHQPGERTEQRHRSLTRRGHEQIAAQFIQRRQRHVKGMLMHDRPPLAMNWVHIRAALVETS